MNDNPSGFSALKLESGHIIDVKNKREIVQGGPVVGDLFIDDQQLEKGSIFGGPMLESGGNILLPRRYRTIFFNGFVLCVVCPETRRVQDTGLKGSLIWLIESKGGELFYRRTVDPHGPLEKVLLRDIL